VAPARAGQSTPSRSRSGTARPRPSLPDALLQPPPEDLDPFLDAAATCFARLGVSHTSIPDVARELGVNRNTVYRRVGTVEDLQRLLLTRDAHRFIDEAVGAAAGEPPHEVLLVVLEQLVVALPEHPVLRHLAGADAHSLLPVIIRDVPLILEASRRWVLPLVEAAAEPGSAAATRPDVILEWLVRFLLTVPMSPPEEPAAVLVRTVVEPLLRNGRRGRAKR
jgi:AcrR family transcriptional regulator